MQDTLLANELDGSWLSSYDGLKVLSLDCFDTLLWRKVVSPADVFFALAHSAVFTRLGVTAPLRARAETMARRIGWIETGSSEVSLEQIYRHAAPAATEAEIAELAAAELACEADYCFVFQPVFALIAQARALGLKVVVVSDTYLSETQLSQLLYAAMPPLEGMIDAVYCSNAHGVSKAEGIWSRLLPLLKVRPDQIAHLGDNLEADFHSPKRFGIHATHFVQQTEEVRKILNGRAQVAPQLLPELGYRLPVPSYHHAQIAAATQPDRLATFGYACMGPIMHSFARYVLDEAAALGAGTDKVKVAFLLRDGFLPSRACAELHGAPYGSELSISRFTAIAATLDSRARVVELLTRVLSREALEPLTRQLLLPPAMAARILKEVAGGDAREARFARLVLQEETLSAILAASRAFRRRLVAHVRKVTGVAAGDTLMLVDLGYSGTAQTLLRAVLKEDLQVELAGRYLIADQVAPRQVDRKGLIDASVMDGRIAGALTGDYIAGFEMLCTQNAPSTVGYTEQGDPVLAESAVGAAQNASVGQIQAACLRFIADARDTPARHRPKRDAREVAQSVAIDLARLLYFPTELELDCMRSFQFDFNLGTDKTIAMFDAEAGLAAMRAEGFGYMNAGLDHKRTSYAMELRTLDLSLSVLLFAQNRYGFDTQPSAASYRKEPLQVLVSNQSSHSLRRIDAGATYDGYFSVALPLSPNFDVGLLLGKRYSWVQIASVQLIVEGRLDAPREMARGEAVLYDQMGAAENGLYQVQPGGMLYLPAMPQYKLQSMCRVVFRPIAWVNETPPGEQE